MLFAAEHNPVAARWVRTTFVCRNAVRVDIGHNVAGRYMQVAAGTEHSSTASTLLEVVDGDE